MSRKLERWSDYSSSTRSRAPGTHVAFPHVDSTIAFAFTLYLERTDSAAGIPQWSTLESLQVPGVSAHRTLPQENITDTTTLIRYMTSLLTTTVLRLNLNYAQSVEDLSTHINALVSLRRHFEPRSLRSSRIGVPLSPLASHPRTRVLLQIRC